MDELKITSGSELAKSQQLQKRKKIRLLICIFILVMVAGGVFIGLRDQNKKSTTSQQTDTSSNNKASAPEKYELPSGEPNPGGVIEVKPSP